MDTRGGLELLYGADNTEGLVGCAAAPEGMRLWWRRATADGSAGSVQTEVVPYQPWFLLSHPHLLDAFKPEPQLEELSGENYYRYRVRCDNWEHMSAAVKHVNRQYREDKSAYDAEPAFAQGDPLIAYLLDTGRTHFKGMALSDVRTLYIAVRASSGGTEYADPTAPDDRILQIGLSDGGDWHRILDGQEMDEKALLEELSTELLSFDPDVLVGHDLFKGSLAYIVARAKRHRVKLNWGRDGSPMKVRASRAPAAEKTLDYPRPDIAGRSCVDTWFLTQYFDIVRRDLERYDAPYVARYLDSTCELSEPVEPWQIDALFEQQPELLQADVRCELSASELIARTLLPSYFAQAQMLPISLQDCVVRGNGMKINWLLLREYLRRGVSIPDPVQTRTFIGGHTEIRQFGLLKRVLNIDIASLYPSIMLTRGIKPRTDAGDVFQPVLGELTRRRLEAKQQARDAQSREERIAADARQNAFKVFINSFFGYLGTDRMHFADPEQAELITTTGQELVKQLAVAIEAEGGAVIEIDTDGVYFTAPEGCETAAEREELAKRVNAALPEGITAELGAFYPAMLSHRIKNYALLDEHGEITVKGSGMKSRGLEPYLHGFIAESIADILREQPQKIEERYAALREDIEKQRIDIRRLAKTDTLIESLEQYRNKTGGGARNKAAAYEVALRARRPLRAGDKVSYYITGDKKTVKAFEAARPLWDYNPANPDYNVAFYVKKLDENRKKVQGFVSAAEGAAATEPSDGG